MTTHLQLKDIPFSCRGSALTVCRIVAGLSDRAPRGADDAGFYVHQKSAARFDPGYYLRALYEDDRYRLLYRLSFDGDFNGMRDEMQPHCLTLSKADQRMQICFAAADTLRFKGRCERFELYLSEREIIKYNAAMFLDDHHIGLNTYTRKSIVYAIRGRLELDAPWGENESNVYIRVVAHPDENGDLEFVYKDFRTEFARDYLSESFEADARRALDSFERFAASLGDCPRAKYADAREAAAFVLWNNVVSPNQLLDREAIFADKEWNCEARYSDSLLMLWALSAAQPELAWAQFELFAQRQDASGAMPAWIGSYKIENRTACAPLGGVVFGELLRTGAPDRARLRAAFEVLSREAAFWTRLRDYDGDGLPEYCAPEECGGEGCSAFDRAIWVEAPELCALLALEYRTLARLAERIGEAAGAWDAAADALIGRMLERLWRADAGEFAARAAGTHARCEGESLVKLLPLLLGGDLPREVRAALLERAPRWMCAAGVASEAPDSERCDEAYALRGCVWAPWVLLMARALRDCGEAAASAALARRFCDNALAQGFRERYAARDGAGLGARASSASAAVFLILLRDYMGEA